MAGKQAFGGFMVRSVALLAALVVTLLPGAARAEVAIDAAAQAMVGGWEISNTDRDRRCPLAFTVDPAPATLAEQGAVSRYPVAMSNASEPIQRVRLWP